MLVLIEEVADGGRRIGDHILTLATLQGNEVPGAAVGRVRN